MLKVEMIMDTTIEGLQAKIEPWTCNGWHLHEGLVITAWEGTKGVGAGGYDTHSQACGFLQILTRTEGKCKTP